MYDMIHIISNTFWNLLIFPFCLILRIIFLKIKVLLLDRKSLVSLKISNLLTNIQTFFVATCFSLKSSLENWINSLSKSREMCSSAAFFLQQPSPLSKRSHLLNIRKLQPTKKINRSLVPVARLFGPAMFESSKLKVLFVGGDDEEAKNPGKLPRTYTLTHSDITSKLTLAISNTINRAQLQGWYNKLQRDEVVAEWMKLKGKMSLHVHCHISGGHFLLDLIAKLRYYIFCKELPVVLKAFVHGDESLFKTYPELEKALVYVYFHSSLPEFNKVQCWGRLRDAVYADHKVYDMSATSSNTSNSSVDCDWEWPQRCQVECDCCFPPRSLVPWLSNDDVNNDGENQLSARQLQ